MDGISNFSIISSCSALGYETLLPNGNCEHTSSDIDNPPDDCAEGESYIARSGYIHFHVIYIIYRCKS